MTRFRLIAAAIVALLFVANLVVTAPARLLSAVVPGDQLQLHGLSGTVWHGSASGMLLRLPQGYLQLGAVHWWLRPLSLLRLAPHLNLESTWGNQTVAGELILRGKRDLDVRNLEVNVAANLLGRFAPVAVDGMFNLHIEHLQLRNGLPYSAKGRLVWQDGSWKSPRGPVPLGSYAMDFDQAPGAAILGQVLTLSGPLQASGSLQLQERHYNVDIVLGGEGTADPQLQQMLSLIAAPEDGGFRIGVERDF